LKQYNIGAVTPRLDVLLQDPVDKSTHRDEIVSEDVFIG
jgi:hypothetical protein